MEENLTILREGSRVSESDVRGYSPLTLAYIGDAVYELLIRTMVVTSANAPVNKLHKKSSLLAKAPAQSAMAEALLPAFTEEELQAGQKCSFLYQGKKRHHRRLPQSHRL